jgi:hypothetical protein
MQDDTICRGESSLLTAYGHGGNFDHYTYTWRYNGGVIHVEDDSVSTYTANPATSGDHVYTVEIFDQYNTFTNQITLHVAASPVFVIAGPGSPIIACPFDTVTLKPNITYPGASYYWSNGSTEPEIRVGSSGIGFDSQLYVLEVSNSNGCAYADSVMVLFDFSACNSIGEKEGAILARIYPNPSEGVLTIDLEDCNGPTRLEVITVEGAIVFQTLLTGQIPGPCSEIIDVSRLPAGVYFLTLARNESRWYHKLIIN